jgi:hypothetical protein
MLDIGQKFVEFTKYQYQTEPSDQNKGLPQPPLADALPEGVAFIKLPKVEDCQVESVDLLTAINRRVSTRKYDPKPLTLGRTLLFALVHTRSKAGHNKACDVANGTLRGITSSF